MKKALSAFLLMMGTSMMLTTSVFAKEDSYQYCFIPEKDGINQPYVGDCMPYYEDGVYYIYYLKEGGDSFRHSIYLTTTTDFVTYTEQQEPVLVSSEVTGERDEWIGTGSVVKIDDTYYLFYTGHTDDGTLEYGEQVMVAKSDNLNTFEKVKDWYITPDDSLGQKRDFRDPQAYINAETGDIDLTITAAQDGVARILKYTLSRDLENYTYDGIIFTDPIGKVYNLECSDTFQIGDTYYLTYSAQDDTLWYAASEEPYGPYSDPVRMDGPLYYAPKHVEDGENMYMAGWARRSGSETSTTTVNEWAGNLLIQKIEQLEDGSLVLAPVDAILDQYQEAVELTVADATATIEAGEEKTYQEICTIPETFKLTGSFTYDGTGSFGLAFEFKEEEKDYKLITIDPENQKMVLGFKGGSREIAEKDIDLTPGETYDFTYVQENSLGVFYIDDMSALTVRLYRVGDKPLRLFAENNNVTFSNLSVSK